MRCHSLLACGSVAGLLTLLLVAWRADLSLTQLAQRQLLPAAASDQSSGSSAGSQSRQLLQQLVNPDTPALTKYGGMTMAKLVPSGYPLEEHKVKTKDGWLLTLYRIPHGRDRNNKPGKRPVIYLHHGITLSSASFVVLNPGESLAYILADAGFDVWMANTRSNTFSRGNYKYSFRQVEYWYHSIDEYALIDNPAMIDYALKTTGAKKLAFVGHSQGGSIGYAMLSTLPEMNDKISVMLHMGPVVYLDYFRAPWIKAMALERGDQIFRLGSQGECAWFRLLSPFLVQCRGYVLTEFCLQLLALMFTGPSPNLSPDEVPLITQTWPASVSCRNVAHWAQQIKDRPLRRFQRYDFGTNCSVAKPFEETCNQQKYGSERPPEYDLSRITAPQVILAGEMDIMAVPDDIAEQVRRLRPGTLRLVRWYEDWAHIDFAWSRTAKHALDIVDVAFRFSPGTF